MLYRDLKHEAIAENHNSDHQFEIILVGDLNCDFLNKDLPQTKALDEFLLPNQLVQLISEPTWETNFSQALIDVLITSTPELFTDNGITIFGISDHFPIYGVLLQKLEVTKHRFLSSRRLDEKCGQASI